MEEQDTLTILSQFVASRDWDQFHSVENLSKSISIEAGELLELFQWGQDPERERLIDELADVLTYGYLLAQKIGVSPEAIILKKLENTAEKYPIEKSKGNSKKYDRL